MSHPLADGVPPPWACAWGQDCFGVFASFEVGDVEHRMRWIPPGRFLMGSPETEEGRYADEVQHPVAISRGFWLGETPVTQDLWQAVMGENPSRFVSARRPVEQISWEDARDFCARLAEHHPELAPRLPSEAEWEHACRAGTSEATWIGNPEILGQCNAPLLDAIAWYGGNSGVDFDLDDGADVSKWKEKQYPETQRAGTRLVGLKQPNSWGLRDMLGNVWEWCEDAITAESADDYTPYPDELRADPVLAAGSLRVIRGGSWYDLARNVRAAFRLARDPGYRNHYLGIRLAGGPALRGGAQDSEARDGPIQRSGGPSASGERSEP